MGREMHGREISEAEVDEWVEEAEAGYDVDALRARLGPSGLGRGNDAPEGSGQELG